MQKSLATGCFDDFSSKQVKDIYTNALINAATSLVGATEKEEKEDDLKNYNAKLLSLLKITANDFHIIDRNYKVILAVNFAAATQKKFLGNTISEGDNILDLLPPEKRALVKADIDKIFEGEVIEREVEFENAGWILIKHAGVYDERKNIIGCGIIVTDITERKRGQAEMQRYRNMLSAMLQTTTNGFQLVDKDYNIILSNDVAKQLNKEILGFEITNGTNLFSILPPERKAFVKANIDKALDGTKINYETYHQKVDVWLYVEIAPAYDDEQKLIGVCCILKDITETKKIEIELSQSEEKFKSAFAYSGNGIALVSTEGKWLDVNPSLCKLLGYSKEELLNLTFQDVTHPDDLEADLAFVRQMLQKDIETYQMEKRYFHKNGNIIWVQLTVSMVWNTGGTPKFFIAQIADISSTKVLIQELENKNASLNFTAEALEGKINQLEEINSMVAHDLRNSAGAINLATQMLTSFPNEINNYAPLLQNASNNLVTILNGLMELAEVTVNTLPCNVCNMQEIATETFYNLKANCRQSDVYLNLDIKTAAINYPLPYMKSILHNLVSNAIKYRRTDVPLLLSICTYTKNNLNFLQVKDNGLGIDLAKHGNDIFKFNKTFHSGFDSKGVGLFITKTQIEKSGGKIEVESEPMKGCGFTVRF